MNHTHLKALSAITPVHTILPSLRDNPGCRVGVLADQRLAYLEAGINSFGQDKEMLVLISDQGDWWYGYVLRVDPGFPIEGTGGAEGEWLAILVQSSVSVDGYSPENVFRNARRAWFELLECHAYFIQAPEDGYALRHSFDEAVTALRRIITRFDIHKRIAWERNADGSLIDPANSRLDRRCLRLFRFLGSRRNSLFTHEDEA